MYPMLRCSTIQSVSYTHLDVYKRQPLSGLLADIYLDFYENNYILNNNIFANNIIFYGRYVDDTFLIFNGTLCQISNLKNHMNTVRPTHNIQFTMETETNNELNICRSYCY